MKPIQKISFQPLWVFLALRIVTLLWMGHLSGAIPYFDKLNNVVPNYLSQNKFLDHYILSPWCRWDALFYMEISSEGYSSQLPSVVWPPLFPFLIRVVNKIFNNPALSSLVVSNISALVAFYLIYQLITETISEPVAKKSIQLLAIFPTSFFLVAGYSESLFLVFVAGFFLTLRRNNPLLGGVLYGLAVLTRLTGMVLILPMAWLGFEKWRHGALSSKKSIIMWFIGGSVGILTFTGFFLYIHWIVGAPWPWSVIKNVWGQHWGMPWEGILGNIKEIWRGLKGVPSPLISMFSDLSLTLYAIFWLLYGRKRIPVDFSLFAWSALLIYLMKVEDYGIMVSMARYIMPLFPVYAAQATAKENKFLNLLWFGIAAFCGLIFMLIFYQGAWIG